MEKLEVYLNDLESRIDVVEEENLLRQWKKFNERNWEENIFTPKRNKKNPPKIEWPDININDALKDDDLMMIMQFKQCSNSLASASGSLMWVRCNYGVGIITSMFGLEKFVMPYEMNTLPNVRAYKNGREDIKKMVESDFPSLDNGWGKDVFRLAKKYREIKEKYPKIAKYVRFDNPDTQGPMDNCELLWGSELFYDLFDEEELVHKCLRKITDFTKLFLDEFHSILPLEDGYLSWFGSLVKGQIALRDDSAMNLSPEMFEEFILPYDDELLTYFEGGIIHYCGRGTHFAPYYQKMKNLNAVNLSQPEYNDMEVIYKNTIDKNIPILALNYEGAVKKALEDKRPLHGLVHTNI